MIPTVRGQPTRPLYSQCTFLQPSCVQPELVQAPQLYSGTPGLPQLSKELVFQVHQYTDGQPSRVQQVRPWSALQAASLLTPWKILQVPGSFRTSWFQLFPVAGFPPAFYPALPQAFPKACLCPCPSSTFPSPDTWAQVPLVNTNYTRYTTFSKPNMCSLILMALAARGPEHCWKPT